MKPKILIIEDEAAIADTIVYALQTDGFDPVWASTGGEGRSVLERERIALIVLDIGLPDANGFELCKELRRDSDTPIIILTARSAEVDRIVGLEIGADDYLVKPFSPRELAARVRVILRRVGGGTAAAAGTLLKQAVPLTVDENRRQISYRNQALELSRYEYEILRTLVQRPGWVFSREKLMAMVWDVPESSLDRTVDTHIKTIRAKLKAVDPTVEPITTHRGAGYSLREDW